MKYKMEKLINRSYEAIKSRGLITDKTTKKEFLDKILEEFDEAYYEEKKKVVSNARYCEELTDIATVCLMQIMHLGYDPVKEFEKVVLKNERRANEMSDKI